MRLDKRAWLIIGAVALIGIGIYLYLRNRGEENAEDTGAVAPGGSTNLNSVAPELVGGPSGPDVTPQVSLPVNITLTTTETAPPPQLTGPEMEAGQMIQGSPVQRQA